MVEFIVYNWHLGLAWQYSVSWLLSSQGCGLVVPASQVFPQHSTLRWAVDGRLWSSVTHNTQISQVFPQHSTLWWAVEGRLWSSVTYNTQISQVFPQHSTLWWAVDGRLWSSVTYNTNIFLLIVSFFTSYIFSVCTKHLL